MARLQLPKTDSYREPIQSAAGAAALAAALVTGQPVPPALLAALQADGVGPAAVAVQRLRAGAVSPG